MRFPTKVRIGVGPSRRSWPPSRWTSLTTPRTFAVNWTRRTTASRMILLDTNILSYAVGIDHRLKNPCRRLLQAQSAGDINAATTPEVVQEFTHIRARRRSREVSTELARYWARSLDLVEVGREDLLLGLSLFADFPSLGTFDAVLAAVALNRQAEALVSADRAFGTVPGLRWIDPATPALDDLISG